MHKQALTLLFLALVAVAGCSSSSGGSTNGDYATPKAVAQAIDCDGFKTLSAAGDKSYADQVGQCTYSGKPVAIVTFADADQRAEYSRIGQTGTGAYPHYVLGSTWAVATMTTAQADSISDKIGGEAH